MTPNEVDYLDTLTFNDMWAAITTIEAQQFLVQTQIASWVHMKKGARDELRREMHKKAYPRGFSPETAALTAKDLAEKMAMRARNGRRK